MVIRASDSRAARNDNLWQIYGYRRKSLPALKCSRVYREVGVWKRKEEEEKSRHAVLLSNSSKDFLDRIPRYVGLHVFLRLFYVIVEDVKANCTRG